MPATNINSVISVVPVKNFELSLVWYTKLFEREPDLIPMEGIAEWKIVGGAWIQVCIDAERAGSTTFVMGVDDIEISFQALSSADFNVGEIIEYPEIIKMIELIDPDGNQVSFVQDISNVDS